MIYNVYKVADVSKYAVTSATKKVHQVFKKDDELFKKVDGLWKKVDELWNQMLHSIIWQLKYL